METNNISTIATFIAIILTSIIEYFGYTIEQETITPIILGIITLAIAIWSSKNPNTLKILGNQPQTIQQNETILNDEYTTKEDENDGC